MTHQTPLCRYCKKCLVGRGCSYELYYEQTGLCNGFEQKKSDKMGVKHE